MCLKRNNDRARGSNEYGQYKYHMHTHWGETMSLIGRFQSLLRQLLQRLTLALCVILEREGFHAIERHHFLFAISDNLQVKKYSTGLSTGGESI